MGTHSCRSKQEWILNQQRILEVSQMEKKELVCDSGLSCSHQGCSTHPVRGCPACGDLCGHRSLCVQSSHCGDSILCMHSTHCVYGSPCGIIIQWESSPTVHIDFRMCMNPHVHRFPCVHSLLRMFPYVYTHHFRACRCPWAQMLLCA